jgi:type IV secretion system protein TrbL
MIAPTVRLAALAMTWLPSVLSPPPSHTATPTPSGSRTSSASPTPSVSVSPPPGSHGGGKGLCDKLGMGSLACHGPGALVTGTLDQIAKEFQQGEVKLVSYLTAWWVRWPTAAPQTDGNGNAIGPVGFITGHTAWLVGMLAVFGLLVAAGRIAWERRGEAARQAISGLFTLTVVTGCAVVVVQFATMAGDSYSNWIINQSLDQHVVNDTQINEQLFQTKMAALTSLENTTLSTALVLILAIFAIVSMLIQLVMMVARIAMVALLTGLLPIGAALSGTPDGRTWWKKMQAWLIAFVLYKPVAATIYAFAFAGMNTIGKDATTKDSAGTAQLVGVVTIILAVLALPALMRFVTPMVSATTTGPGGSASAALAGAAVATGARMLGGGSNGSGGGGGGGAQSSPQGSAQAGGRSQSGKGGGGSEPSGNQPKSPGGNGSTPSGAGTGGGPSAAGGGAGGGGGGPSGSGGGGGGGLALANEAKNRAVDYSKNAADRVQNSTFDEGDDGPSGSR